MKQNIRIKGLFQLIGGTIGTLIIGFIINWFDKNGYELTGWGLIIAGIPAAIGAMGLLQFASGISFIELSKRWDDLTGFQRGIIGLSVIGLCLGALIGGLAFYGYLTL